VGHLLGHAAEADHGGEIDAMACELANRDAGAVDGERREDDVDPAAVEKAAVEQRARLVHPTPDQRGHLLGDARDLRGVAELDLGPAHLAADLDVDLVRTVHHDVADALVTQQRLQRAEADHIVGQFGREPPLVVGGELDPLAVREIVDQGLQLDAELLHGHHGRRDGIDVGDHLAAELLQRILGLLDVGLRRRWLWGDGSRRRRILAATPERLHRCNIQPSSDRRPPTGV
jgi:hypothetical protein